MFDDIDDLVSWTLFLVEPEILPDGVFPGPLLSPQNITENANHWRPLTVLVDKSPSHEHRDTHGGEVVRRYHANPAMRPGLVRTHRLTLDDEAGEAAV